MQYPYLRTDVFQGFREIGNAILFCLQLESFLVRNITFRLQVVPHSLRDWGASGMRQRARKLPRARWGKKRGKDFLSSLRASPFSRVQFSRPLAYLARSTVPEESKGLLVAYITFMTWMSTYNNPSPSGHRRNCAPTPSLNQHFALSEN